jgi:hypothetical protein
MNRKVFLTVLEAGKSKNKVKKLLAEDRKAKGQTESKFTFIIAAIPSIKVEPP